MTHIDFIGIGAPKCGTTWLSAQLDAHPQIGFAPDKEDYYFADTNLRRLAGQELCCFNRGGAWYHEQFPPSGEPFSSAGPLCPPSPTSQEPPTSTAAYRRDTTPLAPASPPPRTNSI